MLSFLAYFALLLFPGDFAAPEDALVIKGGTLIDGTGRPPMENAGLVIREGRIERIVTDGRYPTEGQILDARGKYILPGLIDGHTHLKGWDGELFLAHGVTAVVDLGSPIEWILAQKEGTARGKIRGPRVFASGNGLRGPSQGEADFLRIHHIVIGGPEEGRAEGRKMVGQGVDVIKLRDYLTTGMTRAIIAEAHRAGLPVVGHVDNAWRAIETGYDAIVHTPSIGAATRSKTGESPGTGREVDPRAEMDPQERDRLIQALVKNNVSLNPTLRSEWNWAFKDKFQYEDFDLLFNRAELGYVPVDYRLGILKEYNQDGAYWFSDLPFDVQKTELQALRNTLEFVKLFVAAGGKIFTGSDTMSTPGLSLHQELEILVESVGLSPMEALLTVTSRPAEVYRISRQVGTLEPGKTANLIILRRNPLEQIRNTREIETVILEGKVVDTAYHEDYSNPIPKNTPEDTGHIFPSPSLKSIAPFAATEGDTSATLVVRGTGFIPYSVIRLGGVPLKTQYVSRFELEAELPSDRLDAPGTFPVTVVNPRPVGTVFAAGASHLIPFGERGAESNPLYFIVRFK
ncbi:MAG: amidohydrolase family protein [Acidobacteria bacterium]|nr:amidohydrolase family protein [Acidobacteriota bacterium]